ncbi:hypothetical protein [Flavobacterium haoranii]|uniref:Uncharacterized protein n=1 Tax=Flavobacterium haoranii TaxID=683124 RepID=A0A1M6H3D0_9FLAO|nr:hypothetical protein [Flavobacterium haoranii]SHJ16698.1 hypothetical protein SAMN05444337_1418 [Flavobacterium haoranii]
MFKKIFSIFSKKLELENFDALHQIENIGERKKIDLLIGDKILEIKTHFEYRKINDWLDTSIAFIRLERNGIICFPYSGDEDFENVNIEIKAEPILEKFQNIIYGTTIEDIYYIVDGNEEFDEMQMGYFLLNNDYILEENRMSPSGIGGADMFCKTSAEFEKEILENNISIYSVKNKAIKYSS